MTGKVKTMIREEIRAQKKALSGGFKNPGGDPGADRTGQTPGPEIIRRNYGYNKKKIRKHKG